MVKKEILRDPYVIENFKENKANSPSPKKSIYIKDIDLEEI
jgi:hypothetical protein